MRGKHVIAALTTLALVGTAHAETGLAAMALFPETGKPAQSAFPADTPKIVLSIAVVHPQKGDRVTANWVAENAEGIMPNFKITDSRVAIDDRTSKEVVLTLSKENDVWPAGTYRVDVAVNSAPAKSIRFTIVR